MSPANPLQFASSELWAAHVASQADFPDERLNTRFGSVLEMLAAKPLDAIPQASGSAGQAKAVYRLLDNNRLDVADFLQPLVDTTVDACAGLPVVLAIQDSSSVNYATLQHTRGLGKLNDSSALGLHFHSTIALEPDGTLRGLLHQSIWSRPPDAPPQADQRRSLPIEAKESYKWLAGIEAAEAALDGLPVAQRPRLLHVFDREGDIHEVLERVSASPHGAVIRAAQNRSVAGAIERAFAAVAVAPLVGCHRLAVAAQRGRPPRTATLELRSVTLTLTPSANYPHRQPVTWTLVEAREVGAPPGVEPLHWLLWTTEPASTLAEILAVLAIYQRRWTIEDFHLTLKSGCQVEKLQLETAERLSKALVLYSAIALRIVALRNLARVQPQAPCTLLLSTDAWQALFVHFEGRRPQAAEPVPTVRQAVLWLGRLGGHLNRRRDGLPGVRTLWRGWRDLAILVAGYRAGRRSA